MKLRAWALLAGLTVTLVGCGMASPLVGGAGEVGATVGGVKDLSLARALVDAGQVPSVEDLPYEAAFAEHDLPVAGQACTTALCLRAVATASDGAAWVHLGLSSGVDLATFKRPPLNAAVVLDNSGSMGTEKMEAAKAAARRLVDLLGPDDVLTVIRFDTFSEVLVPSTPVVNRQRFKDAIDTLHADGSTCIECGLKDAFAQLSRQLSPRANRVFLFTDAQPNVAATGAGEFIDLLEAAAAHEQYLTLFGVGLDYGQALATRISAVRGANARFLATADDVRAVFDTDFDLLVTPIAFDLSLKLEPASGYTLAEVYGVPAQGGALLETTIKTVFLSRSRGAIVARLSGPLDDASPAAVKLSYTVAASVSLQPLGITAEATLETSLNPPLAVDPGLGTTRAVVLTRAMSALRATCDAWHQGRVADAKVRAGQATSIFTTAADPEFAADLAFAQKLADLVSK